MFSRRSLLRLGSGLIAAPMIFIPGAAEAAAKRPRVIMQIGNLGQVTVELRPDLAPKHAERIFNLSKNGFYDGCFFHRVLRNFVAQTGGYKLNARGQFIRVPERPPLKAEFTNKARFIRGVFGMARAQEEDSATTEWFINYKATPFLNGRYTIVGFVVRGMPVIDRLSKSPQDGALPPRLDFIERMRPAATFAQPRRSR